MVSVAWGEEQEPLISIYRWKLRLSAGKGVKVSKKGQDGAQTWTCRLQALASPLNTCPFPVGECNISELAFLACPVVKPTRREVLRKCGL